MAGANPTPETTPALGPLSNNEDTGTYTDNDDLVKKITDDLRLGRSHWAKWRERAREDYDFFAGIQWSEEDARALEEQKRPAVVFNRIARTINAVAGLELQNRQEVRYIPRRVEQTNALVSDLLTNAAKWARDNCDAEDEESESFQDNLICGVGWTETRLDYEIEQEGKIIIERVDPLEMLVDPASLKRNFADARWVAHVKQLTKEQFKLLFPNVDINTNTFWNDSDSSPHDATEAPFYDNDQSDKLDKPNYYTVIRYQYWERVTVYNVRDVTGNIVEMPEDKYTQLQGFIQQNNLPSAKRIKRLYKECYITGNTLLEQNDLFCDHFTFQANTGLRDRNNNYWFGLVYLMKDPQRWANKWLSQIQFIINSSAKSGIMAEDGAFKNPRTAEDDFAKPGSITWLNPGGLEKVQPKQAPSYPDGVDRLLNYAINAINDVPGVNLELMGMAQRDQPIGLEETRKKAGITILANFFDALRNYRKKQGRLLAYYIKDYIADGRLIRIVGPEGQQFIPLLRDQLTYEYDIVVDDAPNSPNVKERVFNTLIQIMPMAMQAQIPIPPDILDYAPLPENLIIKWKGMLNNPQQEQMQQEMQSIKQMMAHLEVLDKQKGIQEKDSQINLNYAKAQQASGIGDNQEFLALQKMSMDSATHDMNMQEVHADIARKDAQAQSDIARKNLHMLLTQRHKVLQTQLNAQLKARQMAQNMQQSNQINQ